MIAEDPRLRVRLEKWRCGNCAGVLAQLDFAKPTELIVKCSRCNTLNVLRVVAN